MKLRGYYIKRDPSKLKLRVSYDKSSESRPAWIKIEGLPNGVNFISIFLGRRGKEGQRIQFYKTYLPQWLFLPIDFKSHEMKKFYDEFSKFYDKDLAQNSNNPKAANFLAKKLKKFSNPGVSVLDLGAGTGMISEIFYKEGYKDITLFDYSKGMLEKARKRHSLKSCKFILGDVRKLNLHKKYDVVISVFSLGSSSYFSRDELKSIYIKIKKHLKKNGILAVLGHTGTEFLKDNFSILEAGIYTIDKKRKYYTDYFIGRKMT